MGRNWTLRQVAEKAGLSVGLVHGVEMGRMASLPTYVRLGRAFGLELRLHEARRRNGPVGRQVDLVHAFMGEFEVMRMAGYRFGTGVDEPYQHFQFAGRGDVVSWDLGSRAFLHLENRTRFPNFQESAGIWNAKRAYLADQVASRVGVRRGWASVTHVMVGLWSAEVLHALRLRTASFRSLCPDSAESFTAWWSGSPPASGTTATFVVLDPFAGSRQREFADLEEALTARPRYGNYSDAAQKATAADRRAGLRNA